MQTPLPYVPPSKGLLRSLQAEVQALAHERLAQHLRWYQLHHGLDDEQVAQQMNACPAVVGIRTRKDDAVFAPISEAKIARFKDGKTKPQRLTLEQFTAYFESVVRIPRFMIWTDMDDVLTGFHDARRFRKERTRKELVAQTDCWLLCEVQRPYYTMAFRLTPLACAPVVLVRGRIVLFERSAIVRGDGAFIRDGMEGLKRDAFVTGYATLTPHNLNLYLRDDARQQVILYPMPTPVPSKTMPKPPHISPSAKPPSTFLLSSAQDFRPFSGVRFAPERGMITSTRPTSLNSSAMRNSLSGRHSSALAAMKATRLREPSR